MEQQLGVEMSPPRERLIQISLLTEIEEGEKTEESQCRYWNVFTALQMDLVPKIEDSLGLNREIFFNCSWILDFVLLSEI